VARPSSTITHQAEFEYTKGVIRIRISKKKRQHNGQKKKYKRTNNYLQNITHTAKDRVTRTPRKTGGELRWFERVSSSCSTSGTCRVNQVTNPVISHEWGMDREVLRFTYSYLKTTFRLANSINQYYVHFIFINSAKW
jgi:hypothetical protein